MTDERMTRFWISLEEGVNLVFHAIEEHFDEEKRGGEIFIPKIPSMKIVDLAKVVAPECRIKIIGIRPGEKLHEKLVSRDEARHTLELPDMYVIQPEHPLWKYEDWPGGKHLSGDFSSSRDTNSEWRSGGDSSAIM